MLLARARTKAWKAYYFGKRQVITTLARPKTARRLEALARFEHPRARPLATVLGHIHDRAFEKAAGWERKIEAERKTLLRSNEPLSQPNETPGPYDAGLTAGDACRASRRLEDALALYLMVRELGPDRVLELGTNVGISSAYIAAALKDNGKGRLTTCEASPGRIAVAKRLHARLGLDEVEYVPGLFQDTLGGTLTEPVDFVFIDGHHQYEPTLEYFDRIWRASSEGCVFIFDDIRWSSGMERAWAALQTDARLLVVVDLGGLGIGIGTRRPGAQDRYVTPIIAT